MADLAIVFHWSPAVMDPMPIRELVAWHEKAARRHNPDA